MMNKRAVIITSIVLLPGLILTGTGLYAFHMKDRDPEYPVFDPGTATQKDSGKCFRQVFNSTLKIDDEYTLLFYGDTVEEMTSVIAVVPASMNDQIDNYVYNGTGAVFNGIVTYMSDEEFESFRNSSYRAISEEYQKYEPVRDKFEEIIGMTLEEAVETDAASLTRWKIELIHGNSYKKLCLLLYPGILISLFALITDLCFIFGWKKRFVIPAAAAALLICLFFMFFGVFRTVFSIKKHGDQMYSLTNYSSNHVDAMLDADISSIQEFIGFACDDILYGIPLEFDEIYYACSSFYAENEAGEKIFGRNFDHPESDTVVVYSYPKNGYASIGITTPYVAGIGSGEGMIPSDSPAGRVIMAVLPYLIFDGINEKGLGVSTLSVYTGELHQDTGKPDIMFYSSVRILLDKCADVDEALELLSRYDMHCDYGISGHLLIMDRSGRSVVVEWLDNEMVVTETAYVANDVVAPGEHFHEGSDDCRREILCDCLTECGGIVDYASAMKFLADASQKDFTEWSAVYNLDRFDVRIINDEDYQSTPYYFEGRGKIT